MSTLLDLRGEVTAHGFDVGAVIQPADVTRYLNEAIRLVARKIDYYAEESTQTITTVSGTPSYAWPTDLGRVRYLRNVDDGTTLRSVRLRDIDESVPTTGKPAWYALSGTNVVLYPTPDGVYNLQLRYWALPALLASDTDVPAIPEDYHRILPYYAIQRCYEREDDAEMGTYWSQQWATALADMRVDVKFVSGDGPRQVDSMWDPLEKPWPTYSLP